MKILAVDPGTHCGWCLGDTETQDLYVGELNLQPRRHEGGGMRYLKFRNWLSDIIHDRETVPDLVVYEEVARHKGTAAAHIYGGLVASLAELCERCEVPYYAIPVGTWKKAVTGKGNASKTVVGAHVRRRYPRLSSNMTTDNITDAVGIWYAAYLKYGT